MDIVSCPPFLLIAEKLPVSLCKYCCLNVLPNLGSISALFDHKEPIAQMSRIGWPVHWPDMFQTCKPVHVMNFMIIVTVK